MERQINSDPVSCDEFAPYVAGLVRRERIRRRQMHQRTARALEAARTAAAWLRQRYGGEIRVRLFGSALYPERFHERSDVDLAVEGLVSQDYLSAWALVNGPGSEFEIDLVDLCDCRSYIREVVEREGVDV